MDKDQTLDYFLRIVYSEKNANQLHRELFLLWLKEGVSRSWNSSIKSRCNREEVGVGGR